MPPDAHASPSASRLQQEESLQQTFVPSAPSGERIADPFRGPCVPGSASVVDGRRGGHHACHLDLVGLAARLDGCLAACRHDSGRHDICPSLGLCPYRARAPCRRTSICHWAFGHFAVSAKETLVKNDMMVLPFYLQSPGNVNGRDEP